MQSTNTAGGFAVPVRRKDRGEEVVGSGLFSRRLSIHVIPGLEPGIHAFNAMRFAKTWMAGSSPAMTREDRL